MDTFYASECLVEQEAVDGRLVVDGIEYQLDPTPIPMPGINSTVYLATKVGA